MRRTWTETFISALLGVLLLAAAGPAQAQQIKVGFTSENIAPHAASTFVVQVIGMEQEPVPTVSAIQVKDARIEAKGHQVQGFRQRRGAEPVYVHTFEYTLMPLRDGRFVVEPVTVTQGTQTLRSKRMQFSAETFDEIQLSLDIPQRTLWVGETFEAKLVMSGKNAIMDEVTPRLQIEMPLFQMEHLSVSAPRKESDDQLVRVNARDTVLEVPLRVEKQAGGKTRFVLRFLVTPARAGTFELEPSTIQGSYQHTTTSNQGGISFTSSRPKPFAIASERRTLQIKSLPTAGQPRDFSNVVAEKFAVEVEADRTVVQVGEPVTLTLTVKSSSNLNGFRLPKLAKSGLREDAFQVLTPDPTGTPVLDDEGRVEGMRYRVDVKIKAQVNEIPALEFAYFNTASGTYDVVRSEPVGFSVRGGTPVGPAPGERPNEAGSGGVRVPLPTTTAQGVSLTGADLQLSAPAVTLSSASSFQDIAPWLIVLYGLPLALFGFQIYRSRTQERRELRSGVKQARSLLDEVLRASRKESAREAAPKIRSALTTLLKSLERSPEEAEDYLARLEMLAYDPNAASTPIDADLADEARSLADRWIGDSRSSSPSLAVVLLVGAGLAAGMASEVRADELDAARAEYEQAMVETDRARRTASFQRAAAQLEELVLSHPRSPELLVDWGNAGLGAQSLGTAVLGYRRALLYDARNERARKNLEWTRSQLPEWVPRREGGGAVSALFFWNELFSTPTRHVLAALSFALFLLLVTPWGVRSNVQRAMRVSAVIPLVLWVWLGASVFVGEDVTADAVVMRDGVELKAADQVGAPSAFAQPLPAGAEVKVLEVRDDWVRVELADGSPGWLQASVVEMVVP